MTVEKYTWDELLKLDRILAERISILLPRVLSVGDVRFVKEPFPTPPKSRKEFDQAPSMFIWSVQGTDAEPPILGYVLQRLSDKCLTPVIHYTARDQFESLCESGFGSNHTRLSLSHKFALWQKIGRPFFEGWEFIENGQEISKKDIKGLDIGKEIQNYTQPSLREKIGDDAYNLEFLVLHHGDEGVSLTVLGLRFEHGNISLTHSQDLVELSDTTVKQYPLQIGGKRLEWSTQHSNELFLTEEGRIRARYADFEKKPEALGNAKYEGLVGDLVEISKEAQTAFQQRERDRKWVNFLPPQKKGDRRIEQKANKFVDFVNNNIPDLQLPEELKKDHTGTDHPTYTARFKELPFYDCYDLVEVTEHLGDRARKTTMLWAEDEEMVPQKDAVPENFEEWGTIRDWGHLVGQHILLDGSSWPIHAVNAMLRGNDRFQLSENVAREYLSFFCDYVHGDLGSFSIVESTSEVNWRGFYRRDKKLIDSSVFPMRLWDGIHAVDTSGNKIVRGAKTDEYIIEATLLYGGHLFKSIFAVHHHGGTEMLEDFPLLMELPTQDYRWHSKTRFLLSTFREFNA